MPNTASAKKALRQSKRRRKFNLKRLKEMRLIIKKTQKLIASKNKKEAIALLPQLYKVIDKAAKRGVIKKNTASRYKSRLTRKINKL